MNKKLLCSTALVGALVVSGSALAELKVGGNVTNTINFGADKSSSTAQGSAERLGTEMNVTLSSKHDLKNGMYMQYKANIELDSAGTTTPDVEYQLELGQGNFYVAVASDYGNNISSSPTLPAVGYHVGSLAQNISYNRDPLNYDGLLNGREVNNTSHLSLNYKVAGGTASVLWAPNVTEDDNDANTLAIASGASRIGYIYQGSPMPNVNFIVGRSVETGDTDQAADEYTNDKIGISYNFGQFQAGYEYQRYERGSSAEERADNFAVTFKASDSVTLGVQHSRAKDEKTAGAHTEKLTAISAGYNLGPASIAVSFVDADNLGGTTTAGVDAQGIVITTKMGF